MVCWYKYRTDRNSAFCSSVSHRKFNHCLCNTGAAFLSLYCFSPSEFIAYYAFLFSPHTFTLLLVEAVNYSLFFFLTNLLIFPPTVEEAQFLWKRICFSLPLQSCHLLHVAAAGFYTSLSSLLSSSQTVQFPVILFHCCMSSLNIWTHLCWYFFYSSENQG